MISEQGSNHFLFSLPIWNLRSPIVVGSRRTDFDNETDDDDDDKLKFMIKFYKL